MKITTNHSLKQFLSIIAAVDPGEAGWQQIFEFAQSKALPDYLRCDWDRITFGQLAALQQLGPKVFTEAAGVLFSERVQRRLMRSSCCEGLRFVHEVKEQISRIAALFKRLEHVPTKQELAAGIDRGPSGMHTLADWYARRQGIPDIQEVYNIPWVLVYKALEIDRASERYARNYQQVLQKEQASNGK